MTSNNNTNKGISFWKEKKAENTIKSYQTFLNTYPNTRYTKEALSRMELAAYNKALESELKTECNYYLTKYPNGKYAEQVKKMVLAKIDKSEMDSYKLAISGTYSDCLNYLNTYPKGRYFEEITKTSLVKYKTEENKYYLSAQSGDYTDCEFYMKTYPKSEHFNEILNISKYKVRLNKSGKWIVKNESNDTHNNGIINLLSAGDNEFYCELNNPEITNIKLLNGVYNDTISLFHSVVEIKTANSNSLKVKGCVGTLNNIVSGELKFLVGLPNSRLDITLLKNGFKYNGKMWYPTKDRDCYIYCTENSITGVNVRMKPLNDENSKKPTTVNKETIETIDILTKKLSKIIRNGSLTELENYSPSKIKLRKENPLTVELVPQICTEYYILDSISKPKLSISKNYEFKGGAFEFTTELAGGTILSGKDGFPDHSSDKYNSSYIKSASVSFKGDFQYGSSICGFKSGSLIFIDNESNGAYSEGTIFKYDDKKYIFSNGIWKIQN